MATPLQTIELDVPGICCFEHTFRFFKQTLKWTTPKPHRLESADR